MTFLKTPFNLSDLRRLFCFFIAIGVGAVALLLAPVSQAQNEGRWYNVELLVFKRLGNEAYSGENWPDNIELTYPDYYQYLKQADSGNLSLRPSSAHKLGGFNYTLAKEGEYRVLTHRSWRQRMDSKQKSPAIIISGGNNINGHQELEGSITIYIARFLHVVTDLWLTEDTPSSLGEWPIPPSKPGTNSTSNQSLSNYPVITLRERRRMRSNELHYIDHPKMGVLIMFTPIGE